MITLRKLCWGILVGSGLYGPIAAAQTIPVDLPVFDDYFRRLQLLGKVDSDLSFCVRPLEYPAVKADGPFKILPFSWQQEYNSDHPYGWNDGPMIPAKGYQTMVSGGFYLRYGPLSIQLRPEYVYAQNLNFTGFGTGHTLQDLSNYYGGYANRIDAPEQFGTGPYHKAFWGQSSIRLTFGPLSFGLSTENVWWGPGIQNALILSDNAPGFKHLTFNTTRPVKTFLGAFEWQVLAGRLDQSGYPPLPVNTLPPGGNFYNPPTDDWRYFTGFNINYHPRWIPGLTLGLTRTFNAYEKDLKQLSAYLPFFTAYAKDATSGADGGIGDPFPRDQYTSLYARWLFTRAQAEIYFEYGLNDNAYNLRDFIQSPQHSRAYIFGLRKMIPLNGKVNEHILVSGEITQLSQTVDRVVRDVGGWYQHYQIRQGQTNLGQVLGAGTGAGGNLQYAEVSWVSGLKKLGVSFERYEHNQDFYQQFLPDIDGNSRSWVDFAVGLVGEWEYKSLIFNAKLQAVKSLNYEWLLKDYDPGQPYYIPHNTVYDLHSELGLTYRF